MDGPTSDLIFASENGSTGTVNWKLTDAQGSVRDVAQFASGTTTAVDHVFYTDFGQATQTATEAADQTAFTYNGTWLDPVTKLNHMDTRWYDAVDAVMASQDRIGLLGGTNTERFVGNSPTNFTDPSGMMPQADSEAFGVYQRDYGAAPENGWDKALPQLYYRNKLRAYTQLLRSLQHNHGLPEGPNRPYPPNDPEFIQPVGELNVWYYTSVGEDGVYWVPVLRGSAPVPPPAAPQKPGNSSRPYNPGASWLEAYSNWFQELFLGQLLGNECRQRDSFWRAWRWHV